MNLSSDFQAEKEKKRVEALMSYDIMDTPPEMELDEITKIAFITCETPISLISLLDESRQWFKSNHGLECNQTAKDISFCQHTIQQQDLFIIEDSFLDDRFKSNPFVLGYPFIRFYAGMPLVTPSGYNIGSLCIIDIQPRNLTDNQKFIVKALAKQVITNFELRKNYKELFKSNEKTQRLSNTKEEFFSNMSHELRTPLNAISGFTENLLRTKLEPKQKEQLDIIHSSVNILISIVNDILDYSKIDTGKLKIEEHPFNLRTVVKETYELLKIKAQEKKIAFVTNVNKDVTTYINGDKVRLNQILINLIGNAIKFTNKGSVSLNVSILNNTVDEIEINFSVKDTGIGIPSHKLNGIFDRFQQVEGTTRVYGGSGLGLSISKSLIEMQNGNLEVKSEFGKGSEFNFSIKYRKSNEEEISDFSRTERSNNCTTKPNFNNVRILLAEDNIINVTLIQKVFDGTGAYIDVSENGKLCIDKLKQNIYDIILMDLFMPEMDGYQTTRYIRNTLKLDIPIIGLSANSIKLDKVKCMNEGMNDYVTKPFKIEELFEAISKLLTKNINFRSISSNQTNKNSFFKNKYVSDLKHKFPTIKSINFKYLPMVISKENIFKLKFKPKTQILCKPVIILPSKNIIPNTCKTTRYPSLNKRIDDHCIKHSLNFGKDSCETISIKSVQEYSDNDKEFEKQLVDLFLEQIPQYLKDLEGEIYKEDFKAIKNAAHKIKSPIGIFGLVTLKNKFEKIEELSGKSDIIPIVKSISKEFYQKQKFFSKIIFKSNRVQ